VESSWWPNPEKGLELSADGSPLRQLTRTVLETAEHTQTSPVTGLAPEAHGEFVIMPRQPA